MQCSAVLVDGVGAAGWGEVRDWGGCWLRRPGCLGRMIGAASGESEKTKTQPTKLSGTATSGHEI